MSKQTELDQILARLDVAAEDRAALSRDITSLFERTDDLDATDANLAGDLSEVTDRVAALEALTAPKASEAEPTEFTDACGIQRNARGEIVAAASAWDGWDARQAARVAAGDAETDAFWQRATEGLPPGLWRDPFNIVRKQDGTLAKLADYAGGAQ